MFRQRNRRSDIIVEKKDPLFDLCILENFDIVLPKLQEILKSPNETEKNKKDSFVQLQLILDLAYFPFTANISEEIKAKSIVCDECKKTCSRNTIKNFEIKFKEAVKDLLKTLVMGTYQKNNNLNTRLHALQTINSFNCVPYIHEALDFSLLKCILINLIDTTTSKREACLLIQFIRTNFKLYDSIDEAYIYALFAQIENQKSETKLLCIETILEIAMKKPELVSKCKIMREMLRFVITNYPQNDVLIEAIVTVITSMLSIKSCRLDRRKDDIYNTLMVPFVDFNYLLLNLSSDEEDNSSDSDKPSKINIDYEKMRLIYLGYTKALASLLKTYSGCVYLASFLLKNEPNIFVCPLVYNDRSIDEKIKVYILDNFLTIFYQIFEFDYEEKKSLAAVQNAEYSLQDEFNCFECKSFINYGMKREKSIGSIDFKKCHMSLLLRVFIEAGMIETLVELYYSLGDSKKMSILNRNKLSTKCVKLLAELNIMASGYLGNDFTERELLCRYASPYKKFLENQNKRLNEVLVRERESEISEFIFNFYETKRLNNNYGANFSGSEFLCKFMRKYEIVNEDAFLMHSMENIFKCGPTYNHDSLIEKIQEKIKKSGLLEENPEKSCDWCVISTLFDIDMQQLELDTDESYENLIVKYFRENENVNKFLGVLVQFFSKSKEIKFSLFEVISSSLNFFKESSAKQIIFTSYHLIDFLIKIVDFESLKIQLETNVNDASNNNLIILFLKNIRFYFDEQISVLDAVSSHNEENLVEVLNKQYFLSMVLFIGHFSSSVQGDYLLNKMNIYDRINKFIDKCDDTNLIKYLISSLNYSYSSTVSCVILVRCLSSKKNPRSLKYVNFKIFVLKLIRNILYQEICVFDNDSIKIVINLFTDDSVVIREYALKLFDEVILFKPQIREYLIKNNLVPFETLKNFNKSKRDERQIHGWAFAQFVLNRFLLNLESQDENKFRTTYLNEIINNWIDTRMDTIYSEILDINSFDAYSVYLDFFDIQNGLSLQLNEPNVTFDDDSEFDNTNIDGLSSHGYRQKSQTYTKDVRMEIINPLHLYTALSVSSFDEIIKNNKVLEEQIWKQVKLIIKCAIILKDKNDDTVCIKNLRASLYAIACLCSTDEGIRWLIEQKNFENLENSFEFFTCFVKIAEDHSNYVSLIFFLLKII